MLYQITIRAMKKNKVMDGSGGYILSNYFLNYKYI